MELAIWRIDPDDGWLLGWVGGLFDEAVRVGVVGSIEGFLALGVDLVGLSVVDLVRRHQADAVMVVIAIVPIEEGAAESLGVLDGAEAPGKLRLVFAGLEEALGEGIVVGGMRAAVGFGDAEVGQQEPSVPMMMRQATPGSFPSRAEVETSDGYAAHELRQ